jgi:hypothetical protein
MNANTFSPLDQIAADVALLDNDALYGAHGHLENLNSNTASERLMEYAVAVRTEIARQENGAAKSLGIDELESA